MKKIILILICLTLTAAAGWAEDYHMMQSQVADEVPMHGSVDSATVYVLVCPDHHIYVFRAFYSHEMEEIAKHFPSGSVLHYDGNALAAQPKQAELDKLTAFCKSKGIVFQISPNN